MTRKQAIFELYIWLRDGRNNFHGLLYTLIAKADSGNLHRLSLGFPIEVNVFKEWRASETSEEFFKKEGV